MHILASALPGFRDIRAPLTAGYMWLIFLYLVVQPDFDQRPTDEFLASAFDLAERAGPVWVAVAVSTVAYLVGSITEGLTELVYGAWLRRAGPQSAPLERPRDRDEESYDRRILDSFDDQEQRGVMILRRRDLPESVWDEWREGLNDYVAEQRISARREPDLPAMLLVADDPTLFAEVDRLRAEGDLRLTVALPLTALIVLMASNQGWVWAIGLAGVAALGYQGIQKRRDSRTLIIDAIQMGKIKSPSLARLAEYVDDMEERLKGLSRSDPLL